MAEAAANNNNDWCLIESDPAVFTALLESWGSTHLECTEVVSLDEAFVAQLTADHTVYGLVFLFEWNQQKQQQQAAAQEADSTKQVLNEDAIPEDLFFAHQVTTNACATQALLSIVLNNCPSEQLGPTLTEFKTFTSSFNPNLKGLSISSSDDLKAAHNAFGRSELPFLEKPVASSNQKDAKAFHFVAYVPVHGVVYELDGLQKGPVVVGTVEESETEASSSWISLAAAAIQERMQTVQNQHIEFNLMAVIQDPRLTETDPTRLAELEAQREQWKRENERRRHNALPLALNMLKELVRLGTLDEHVTKAKETKKRRLEARKK